jgi:hypothetical protein
MLGGVTVLYALICWAFIAIDPVVANDDTAPLAVAAAAIAGPAGAIAIAIAATFGQNATNGCGAWTGHWNKVGLMHN